MIDLLNQALYITSGTAWSIAYILIIIRGFRDKTYGMPFVSLALNVSWEFLFSTLFKDGNIVHQVVNSVWFCLDVLVLFTYFRFGIRDWPRRVSTKFFVPYSVLVLVAAFATVWFVTRELHDNYGAYMAYCQNLLMSVFYIIMFYRRGNLSGQSTGIAVAKLIGTGSYTIIFYVWHAKALAIIGGLIVLFDVVYLLLVVNEGRPVWPFRLRLRS